MSNRERRGRLRVRRGNHGRVLRSLIVVAIALVVAGCSGSGGPNATPTTLGRPDITQVPPPAHVGDQAFHWYLHPAPNGTQVLLGVRQLESQKPRGAILLIHASAGLSTDYVRLADDLVARGFDVALGCWFASVDVGDATGVSIPCTDAPSFKGVVDAAV